jgi:hypothetical protein
MRSPVTADSKVMEVDVSLCPVAGALVASIDRVRVVLCGHPTGRPLAHRSNRYSAPAG